MTHPTQVRKRAKEALALFALQWTRLQKGIPASESLKGEHLKQTAVFLTATKLALMRKHHALTRCVARPLSRGAEPEQHYIATCGDVGCCSSSHRGPT